ncbi:MAG TPA: hypothetical protein VN040_19935 [Pseudosphingobacterium sp.]|nr:hypothetical protein [Pseudosphingobacterium sp.]
MEAFDSSSRILGVSAHPISQGKYNNIPSVGFLFQLQVMQDAGLTFSRVDFSTLPDGTLQTTSPYTWGRLYGTQPSDVNVQGLPDTDGRKQNFGWYHKCTAVGIKLVNVIQVISRDNTSQAYWTDKYATPQDAYDAGYNQISGFLTNYGDKVEYIEYGNELEISTDLIINGNGQGLSNYNIDRLDRAVQYVAGMEAAKLAVKPSVISMFGHSGWLPVVLLDRVLAAAPTIDKIVWHWYSNNQNSINNPDPNHRLPNDGKLPPANSFTNIFDYIENRYPGKKVWFTEAGYRYSETLTDSANEDRMISTHQRIWNDFINSTAGEAYFWHELIDMMGSGSFSTEKHHGIVGYIDYDTNGASMPYVKKLGTYLHQQKFALDDSTKALIDYAAAQGYSFLSDTNLLALNQFIVSLKTANLFSEHFDILYLFASDGDNNFRSLNLINPAQYKATIIGGITTSIEGFKGNGTDGYIDTGFIPQPGNKYTLNNASRIANLYIQRSTNIASLGSIDGVNGTYENRMINITINAQRINNGIGTTNASVGFDGNGLKSINRIGPTGTSLVCYNKGIRISRTADSVSLPSSPQLIMKSGTTDFGDMGIGLYGMGAAFTDTTNNTFRSILNTYLGAIGLPQTA